MRILFLALALPAILWATPGIAQDPDEVGGAADTSLQDLHFTLPHLQHRFQISIGTDFFMDEELGESYGMLPGAELGYTMGMNDRVSFFATAGYYRSQGDPYFDEDGMSDEDGLLLESIPLVVGFLMNASDNPDFRMYLSVGVGPHFVRERIPTLEGDLTATAPLFGARFFLRPEWNLGRGALGVELGFGGARGQLSRDGHIHDIDMWAFQPRIVYTLPWR